MGKDPEVGRMTKIDKLTHTDKMFKSMTRCIKGASGD